MRKRYMFLFSVSLTMLFTVAMHAQEWKFVESGVTCGLYDVQFVNPKIGWAVGTDSLVIKTTNGGWTWFEQKTNVRGVFNALWFLDENDGWVAGGYQGVAIILHTDNGGETWERQSCEARSVKDIQFTSKDTGWVTTGHSNDGRVYRTTNGGADWIAVGVDLFGEYTSLSFINNMEGWIGGATAYIDVYNAKMIYHTSDAGQTWEYQECHCWGPIDEISFIDENIGFADGWSMAVVTKDGGKTWEDIWPMNGIAMFCLDVNHVYMVRNNSPEFQFFWLSDTGRVSNEMQVESIDGIRGICFIDSLHGWAVGENGKIWVYDPTATGIEEIPSPGNYHVSAYPNPVGNGVGSGTRVTIALEDASDAEHVTVQLYDVLGRSVALPSSEYTSDGRDIHLSVQGLNTGQYLYCITSTRTGAIATGQICVVQ